MESVDKIREFLTKEGFRPESDGGVVKPKYEGERLWVIQDEKDPGYVRVVFFNFWPIESDARAGPSRAREALAEGSPCDRVWERRTDDRGECQESGAAL